MDPTTVARLMAGLGIKGFDPTKMSMVMELAQLLGENTEVSEESVQTYFPEEREESMYIPKMPSKNFYFDQETIKKLVTPNLTHLAGLHTPDLGRLRRLGWPWR